MQRLKETAQEGPSGLPKFSSKMGAAPEQLEEMEATMMATPIPGQSLTQNPEIRLPFERPPKFPELQPFIDETFLRFTDEEALPQLLDSLRYGLPVEYVSEKYLMNCFKEGEITPDLLMLAIEPTIYMLISIATYAEIDPVLYPEDPMVDERENKVQTDLYKTAVKELMLPEEDQEDDGKITLADIQAPATVPQSLLARTEQAVKKVKSKGDRQ